jgi:Fic family protein
MPLVVPSGKRREYLLDLAGEAISRASGLNGSATPDLRRQLRLLTGIINTYASNLIEGHDTRPHDILRAVNSETPPKDQKALIQAAVRSAQLQVAIDDDEELIKELLEPDVIRSLHRGLFLSTPELLETPDAKFCGLPGKTRGAGMHVKVGEHIAPRGEAVDELLENFLAYYKQQKGLSAAKLIDAAAMHHRLLYLHPFAEGNGRTVRIYTHALMHRAGAGGGGLWSISRGLARGTTEFPDEPKGQYKALLASADKERQGATTDGRGALSLKGLEEFVEWFLLVAIDQIDFMSSVYDLPGLRARAESVWAARLAEKPILVEQSIPILRRLFEGELPRKDAWALAGKSPRTGRNVVARLVEEGLVYSESERGGLQLSLAYPGLLPGLF